MILIDCEDFLMYNGIKYSVGDVVIANDSSIYKGSVGIISEIRDGDDKETENFEPDIYCSFYKSVLGGKEKNPDDFEMVTQPAVIMAPSILLTPAEIKNTKRSKKVYLLIEDVVCDGSIDKRISIYTNQEEAKSILELYVRCSMSYGTLRYLLKKPECIQNSTENSYEAFVMGMYDECHYRIKIEETQVFIDDDCIDEIGKMFVSKILRNDFESQISDWDEILEICDDEYYKMVDNPELTEKIKKSLIADEGINEAYWQNISEIAHNAVQIAVENSKNSEDGHSWSISIQRSA